MLKLLMKTLLLISSFLSISALRDKADGVKIVAVIVATIEAVTRDFYSYIIGSYLNSSSISVTTSFDLSMQ